MKHMERYFDGYEVPKELKRTVKTICTRFAIIGECDPVYIANTIASANGFGDGRGHFTDGAIINPSETAECIQRAYGCNILPSEKKELEEIIRSGVIDKKKAMNGLGAFRQRTVQEIRKCDPWRIDYLKRLIWTIDWCVNTIAEGRIIA